MSSKRGTEDDDSAGSSDELDFDDILDWRAKVS